MSSDVFKFQPTSDGDKWYGSTWVVTDENALAELVAGVAMGQSEHVLQILQGAGVIPFYSTQRIREGATKLLTSRSSADSSHRDGWLFQTISWIAAHLQDTTSLKFPPQTVHADKGLDGFHLVIDQERGQIVSMVLCEDKATTNPRATVKGDVWPAFFRAECGERDVELIAKTSTLLRKEPCVDAAQAIRTIMWHRVRSYRLAITISDTHNSVAGRRKLFEGYDTVVQGDDRRRRRADTFYQSQLRVWMAQFAAKVLAVVNTANTPNV